MNTIEDNSKPDYSETRRGGQKSDLLFSCALVYTRRRSRGDLGPEPSPRQAVRICSGNPYFYMFSMFSKNPKFKKCVCFDTSNIS